MKKLILLIIAGILAVSFVMAEDEDKYEKEYKEKTFFEKLFKKFKEEEDKPTTTRTLVQIEPLYKQECGACHMPYQPEFLPKRSWKKMMATLEDHFGVDATLEKEDEEKILKYLLANAADSKKVYGEFNEFLESIPKNKTPLRISEIPYFKKEHRKIPKKYISQKEVKTIANCNACHKKAQSGDYSERYIDIPNYGRWED